VSDPQQLSLEEAYGLILTKSKDELRAVARSAPAQSPAKLLLEGQVARGDGDVDRSLALMYQAYQSAPADERVFVANFIAPIHVMRTDFEALDEILDRTARWDRIPGSKQSFESLLAAGRNDARGSQQLRAAALRDLDYGADEATRGRALQRLALSAYMTGDTADAMNLSLLAARSAIAGGDYQNAAAAYSIAYSLEGTAGNTDLAYELAGRVVEASRRAGDESFEIGAMAAQCEIAAEHGDAEMLKRHRDEVLVRALPEQYHFRFILTLSELLFSSWMHEFAAARASAAVLADVAGEGRGERAISLALISLIALADGDDATARASARRALSVSTALRGEILPPYEIRNVAVARALAATACVLMGDELRGRRALAVRSLAPYAIARDLTAVLAGRHWEDVPQRSRGFARLVAAVRDAMARRRRGLLTPAELEVLKMLADGQTAGEIAARTKRSVNTIRAHRNAILAKLDAKTTLEAINVARRAGFVT
jgi:DNA-binding CsgD family transcriptional regulator